VLFLQGAVLFVQQQPLTFFPGRSALLVMSLASRCIVILLAVVAASTQQTQQRNVTHSFDGVLCVPW
jgi:hypothetical protein